MTPVIKATINGQYWTEGYFPQMGRAAKLCSHPVNISDQVYLVVVSIYLKMLGDKVHFRTAIVMGRRLHSCWEGNTVYYSLQFMSIIPINIFSFW